MYLNVCWRTAPGNDYLNENLYIMKTDPMLGSFLHIFSASILPKNVFAIFYTFSIFFLSFFSFSVLCCDLKNTSFITMFYIKFYYWDIKQTTTTPQFSLSSPSIPEPLQY